MSALELDLVSTKLQRIAKLAKRDPGCSFTSLAYHIDLAWLERAYDLTRKDGAAGIDEVTAKGYEQDLETNLKQLFDHPGSPAPARVYPAQGR